jgi:hypothetical protein
MSTWRDLVSLPITSLEGAAQFVEKLGFCTWAPLPSPSFPNVADAMVESAWSVMGVTWYWKDDVHFEKRLYYAKIIRAKPSFITPEFLPDFIAAIGGRGKEEERNPVRLYLDGRLSREAKSVYECLTDNPELPTVELRRKAGLTGAKSAESFDRAMIELQRRFVICKVGLSGRTRGTYSYIWNLAERFWPDAFDEARRTPIMAARANIRERLRAFGVEPTPTLESRLFLWT